MHKVILWRLAQFPLILAIIYVLTFLLAWVAPGDPFANERNMDKLVIERLQRQFVRECRVVSQAHEFQPPRGLRFTAFPRSRTQREGAIPSGLDGRLHSPRRRRHRGSRQQHEARQCAACKAQESPVRRDMRPIIRKYSSTFTRPAPARPALSARSCS